MNTSIHSPKQGRAIDHITMPLGKRVVNNVCFKLQVLKLVILYYYGVALTSNHGINTNV